MHPFPMRNTLIVLALAVAMPVFAQRTKDEVEKHRGYIEDLFKRVEWLEGSVRDLAPQVAEMSERLDQALARTAKDQDEVHNQLLQIRQSLDRISQRLDAFTAGTLPTPVLFPNSPVEPAGTNVPSELEPPVPPAAPHDASVAPEPTPPSLPPEAHATEPPEADTTEMHRQARADLMRGRYSQAVDGFQRVYDAEPRGPRAAEALFGLGQALLASGNPQEALDAFQRVPQEFPDSGSAPAALLKAGQTLNGLGRKEEASALLEKLVTRYPDSEEARLAQLGSARRGSGEHP